MMPTSSSGTDSSSLPVLSVTESLTDSLLLGLALLQSTRYTAPMDTVKTRTVVYGIAPGIRLKVTQTVTENPSTGTQTLPTIEVTPHDGYNVVTFSRAS